MLKLVVYFSFIGLTLSGNANFLRFIENNINETIDPCDNFYRHSCSKTKPENETLFALFTKKFSETLKKYKLPDDLEFVENWDDRNSTSVLLDILQNRNQTENIETIMKDYFESCISQNTTTMKYILNELESTSEFSKIKFMNLIYDKNCTRSSDSLKKNLQKVWYSKTKGKSSFTRLETKINNIRPQYWYLKNTQLTDLHKTLFEEFKNVFVKQIKNATWIKLTDTLDAFERIANQMIFKNCLENPEKDIEEIANISASLEACRSNYSIKSLNVLCYFKIDPTFTFSMRDINAYNLRSHICFHHSLMNIMTDVSLPGLFYGSTGWIMAHEIGHTFVKSARDLLFIPDSSEKYKKCVQDQFNSTCSFFKEKSCDTRDDQFDENGSDIIGHQISFDVMKKKYGNQIHDIVPGSKYNFTNAQLFFYASNIIGCSRGEVESSKTGSHHAGNARRNAASVQIPDFAEVFKCDENSRMMKSKTEQCDLFGENS